MAEALDDVEDVPRVASPLPVSPRGPGRPKGYHPKPKKSSRPLSKRTIKAGVDGMLGMVSTAYVLQRGPPALHYDPDSTSELYELVTEWGEQEGFSMPMWLQVTIAAGACVVPAVIEAETARASIGGMHAKRADAIGHGPNGGAAQTVRASPIDSGHGQAGLREDVVDPKLDPIA